MRDGEIPIRRAVTADAAAIAAIHVRARRSAYRGILPDDPSMASRSSGGAAQWREWLDGDPAATFTLVAEAGRAVVGFCALRTPRPGEDPPSATAPTRGTTRAR